MRGQYEAVLLLYDPKNLANKLQTRCETASSKKNIKFESTDIQTATSKDILTRLEMVLKKNSREQT